MNQSGSVDFLNFSMKKVGLLQILELFTDLKNIHKYIKIFRLRISPFIKAMLIVIIF